MGANAQTSVPAFTSGQVLTAAQMTQVNTGIPVFASSTERDAAFGGTGEKALAEGQTCYLEDTNVTQVYDGSTWTHVAGGIYTDYSGSITYNNLTLGNGSHGSFYARIGNFVHFYGYIIFGSTTSVTGAVQWSLPITAYQSAPLHPNQLLIENVGTALVDGAAYLASNTLVGAFAKYAGATYVEWQAVSASIPVGTWAANDKIIYDFMYRAA